MAIPKWHPRTIGETFELICAGTDPWVAIGNFLDDWRYIPVEQRNEMVFAPMGHALTSETQRWAAFCAAMVEWLCQQDGLPVPEWIGQASYILPEPWFLYKGWRLRAWQLANTPIPFMMRNIFGGDRMLNRV